MDEYEGIPTYAEAVKADLEEARDKRIQEKINRLQTFGLNINPLDLIAISVDAVVGLLVKANVFSKDDFDDVRLGHLEEMLDLTLAELGKPKLTIVKN